VNRQVSYRRWAPYAFLAAAAIAGLGLSRLPVLRLFRIVGGGAATVLTVVRAYDTVRNRFIRPAPDDRREPPPAGAGVRPSLTAAATEPRVDVPAADGGPQPRPDPRAVPAVELAARTRNMPAS
jgi:hypothetical protein